MPSLSEPVVTSGRMRALGQPTLEATDLLVRPWRADDAEAVFHAYQDPEIQHWHDRSMTDLAEATAWIESWPDRWRNETGGDWAVTAHAAVVGRVGLTRLDLWDGDGRLACWVTGSRRADRGRNTGRGPEGRPRRRGTAG